MTKDCIACLVLLTSVIASAEAGTGGTEFDDIYTLLAGWTQGTLGKIISLSMFISGIARAVSKQSLTTIPIELAAAISLYYGPELMGGVVTATI